MHLIYDIFAKHHKKLLIAELGEKQNHSLKLRTRMILLDKPSVMCLKAETMPQSDDWLQRFYIMFFLFARTYVMTAAKTRITVLIGAKEQPDL